MQFLVLPGMLQGSDHCFCPVYLVLLCNVAGDDCFCLVSGVAVLACAMLQEIIVSVLYLVLLC